MLPDPSIRQYLFFLIRYLTFQAPQDYNSHVLRESAKSLVQIHVFIPFEM